MAKEQRDELWREYQVLSLEQQFRFDDGSEPDGCWPAVTDAVPLGTQNTCQWCLAPESASNTKFKRCTRCKVAQYCCKEHQVQHWKNGHKADCRPDLVQLSRNSEYPVQFVSWLRTQQLPLTRSTTTSPTALSEKQRANVQRAVEQGDWQVFETYVSKFPGLERTFTIPGGCNLSLLQYVAGFNTGNHAMMTAMLLKAKADTQYRDFAGDTALLVAVREHSVECARMLLEVGECSTQECRSRGGVETRSTALHLIMMPEIYHEGLSERGSPAQALEIVKLLCKHNADINAASRDGTTPFVAAVRNDHCNAVEYFLSSHKSQIKFDATWQTTAGPLDLDTWVHSVDEDVSCREMVYAALLESHDRSLQQSIDQSNKIMHRLSSSSAHADFEAGQHVTIVGIVNRPELNGEIGQIRSFNPEKGRFAVALPMRGIVNLKPSNLRALPGPEMFMETDDDMEDAIRAGEGTNLFQQMMSQMGDDEDDEDDDDGDDSR